MGDTQYGKIRGETVRKNTQYRMRNTLRKTYSGNKKHDLNKKTILSNNTRYEQKKTKYKEIKKENKQNIMP